MKKGFISALTASLLFSFATGCGNQAQTFPIDQLQAQGINDVSTFAKRNSNAGLTVGTYNVRNLFDGKQNPGKPAETAKPEKELIALAAAIRDLNADVIAMEEVESKPVLEGFLKKYVPEMGYKVVLIEGNDGRGIDVAIVTRLQVTNTKSHKNVSFNVPGAGKEKFERDLLQVQLRAANGYTFTTFVAHLKSQHGGDPADVKREAEATMINEIVGKFQDANPSENFIVMGDFNDTYDSQPLKPLLRSSVGLNDVILKDLGTADYVYTYHPQKYRSRIDFMLVSKSMNNEYISKSVEIHKFPKQQVDEDSKWIFYQASDHLPVTAKFDISNDR